MSGWSRRQERLALYGAVDEAADQDEREAVATRGSTRGPEQRDERRATASAVSVCGRGATAASAGSGAARGTARGDSSGTPAPAAAPGWAAAVAPRRVLMLIVEGSWERVPEHAAAAAALFGRDRALAAAAAVATRSASVANASVRAARRALAMRVEGEAADRAAPSDGMLNQLIDAWLAQTVLVVCQARGIDDSQIDASRLPARMSLRIKPSAASNEFGAIEARLKRGKREWSFPELATALEAVAARDRRKGPAAHRSSRGPCWPKEVFDFLESRRWNTDRDRSLAAALAMGAIMGVPITLTRLCEVEHLTVLRDERGSPAVELGIPPRIEGGRKVLRRRLVEQEAGWAWTGAAGPLVSRYLVPWYRRARDRGLRFLFPKFSSASECDGEQPVTERALRAHLHLVRPEATGDDAVQWHDLRRGIEHAVDRVHELAEGPERPVPTAIKNALTQRSNLKERGSRDTYIREAAAELFAATRAAHLVAATVSRGLVLSGGVQASKDDAPFDAQCAWCDAELDRDSGDGALCDRDGCTWCLCRACWGYDDDVPLLCPDHEEHD